MAHYILTHDCRMIPAEKRQRFRTMGKQQTPRVIAGLPEGSLQRSDAEELYAETPKRVLFDALWDAIAQTSVGTPMNPYDITVEMWTRVRKR